MKLPAMCAECRFFKPNTDESSGRGQCHRYAPRPSDTGTWRYWPELDRDDWCGEFEATDRSDGQEPGRGSSGDLNVKRPAPRDPRQGLHDDRGED